MGKEFVIETPAEKPGWPCPRCGGMGTLPDGGFSVGPEGTRIKPATKCALCNGGGRVQVLSLEKFEELEESCRLGYEFLRRWQSWATVVMRKLGEVDEDTFPDDTNTREVVAKKLEELQFQVDYDEAFKKIACAFYQELYEERDALRELAKKLFKATQPGTRTAQHLAELEDEGIRLGCLEKT